MDFITELLQNEIFTSISNTIVGYLNDGVAFFETQDILIQVAVIACGGIIIFLGAIDLVKRLSKLLIIAVIIFGLWFAYTNFIAA